MALPKRPNARITAGVITARTTTYSAIVCASSRRQQERMRSIRPERDIPARSADCGGGHMPRPGDPRITPGIRPGWDDWPVAAPPPGPGVIPLAARDRLRGAAEERRLLLSLVLEHAARRGLRPLDSGRASAALRSRLPVLSCPRALLQRRSARAAGADSRDRLGRHRRGRQFLVGAGLVGGHAPAGRDPGREEISAPSRRA